jgi:hypothetical protein
VDELAQRRRGAKVLRVRGLVPLVGLLVAVALFYGWTVWQSHSYKQDFKSWETSQKFKLTTTSPLSPVTAFGYSGYFLTDQDLQTQKSGCAEIRSARKAVNSSAAALPALAGYPLSFVNPTYDELKTRADRRRELVEKYRAQASGVLEQIGRDCRFVTPIVDVTVRQDELTEKAEKLLDPAGSTSSNFVCEHKDGCLPLASARLKRYQSLLAEWNRLSREEVLPSLKSGKCGRTSMGESCESYARVYEDFLDADRAYVRKITGSDSDVSRAADRANRALETSSKKAARMLERRFTGLKSFKKFQDDPTSPDAFFDGITFPKVRDLMSARGRFIEEFR